MNVALIFAGISFGYKSDRDFRHCFSNISKNLIEPLKAEHEVKTYLYTYDNEYLEELRATFNAVKLVSIPFEGSKQNPTRKSAFEMVDGEDIDFYIMLRFDLHFNYSLDKFNFNFEKFNFTSREGRGYWDNQKFVGDTLFAWPKRLHENVRQAFIDLQKHDANHMHNFYSVLSNTTGIEDIHFMSEEHQLSGHLLNTICTRDIVSRLRGEVPLHEEVLARFS